MQGPSSYVTIANTLIIEGTTDGLFLYQGVGAAGNSPILAASPPGTTTDPFGNMVHPVVTVGNMAGARQTFDATGNGILIGTDGVVRIVMSNGTYSGQPPFAGTDPCIIFYNDFGAIVLVVDPQAGGIFQYHDTGSATQGSLIGWQSSKNATDPVTGISISAGVQLTDPVFGDFIQIVGADIIMGIGVVFGTQAQVTINSASGTQGPYMHIRSPAQTTTGIAVHRYYGESTDGTIPAGHVFLRGIASSTITRETTALVEVQGDLNLWTATGAADFTIDPTSNMPTVTPVDGNTYRMGQQISSIAGQLVNSATPAAVAGAGFSGLRVGNNYRVRYVIIYTPTATSTGAPVFSWVTSGAFTSFIATIREFINGTPGTLGNFAVLSSRASTFTGAAFSTTAQRQLEIDLMLVNPSVTEVLTLQAACTVAADTYNINGSYAEMLVAL